VKSTPCRHPLSREYGQWHGAQFIGDERASCSFGGSDKKALHTSGASYTGVVINSHSDVEGSLPTTIQRVCQQISDVASNPSQAGICGSWHSGSLPHNGRLPQVDLPLYTLISNGIGKRPRYSTLLI